MANKLLSLLCIVGGGIAIAGLGAIVTHYSLNSLSGNKTHKKEDKSEDFEKKIEEKKRRINVLKKDLEDREKAEEDNSEKISKLTKEKKDLMDQIFKKEDSISQRDKDIGEKTVELNEKEKIYKEQEIVIQTLGDDVIRKEDEIKKEKEEVKKINSQINALNERLHLKKEDILMPNGLQIQLLDIDMNRIQLISCDGEIATFVMDNGETFKVKKQDIPDHGEIFKTIRDKGLKIEVPEDTISSWNKTVTLNIYELDCADKDKNNKYLINERILKINIGDYFKEKYFPEAIKVLMEIKYSEDLPIHYESASLSEVTFAFDKNAGIGEIFKEGQKIDLGKQLEIKSCRFKDFEDLIGFWILKTLDLVRTGKSDFTDFLNPMFKKESYQKSFSSRA